MSKIFLSIYTSIIYTSIMNILALASYMKMLLSICHIHHIVDYDLFFQVNLDGIYFDFYHLLVQISISHIKKCFDISKLCIKFPIQTTFWKKKTLLKAYFKYINSNTRYSSSKEPFNCLDKITNCGVLSMISKGHRILVHRLHGILILHNQFQGLETFVNSKGSILSIFSLMQSQFSCQVRVQMSPYLEEASMIAITTTSHSHGCTSPGKLYRIGPLIEIQRPGSERERSASYA